jgi:hypothetical protein
MKADTKSDAIPAEPVLKGGPAMTLIVGKTEGESTFVRKIAADGTKTDYKVPATSAALAVKSRFDFFDLKFKEFAPINATKLSFNRGSEQFVIERSPQPDIEYPTGKWTFSSPPSLKGKIADTEKIGGSQLGAGLLGRLAKLDAASVVSEAPTDAELKAMGLDATAPRLKVTVTLNDEKDKERVYLFGNETADKSYVHFKFPSKPIVYLVLKVNVDAFLSGDLADPTPYHINTADVKKIVIKGWKKKLGKETTLTFERNGDTWTAKETPPWTTTPASMTLLLNHFRAPKPTAVLGPEKKPEYGTDPTDPDALNVMFFKNVGDPEKDNIVQVILGNLTNNDENYFAYVTGGKNIYIKLHSPLFKQFKDGPEFFKK